MIRLILQHPVAFISAAIFHLIVIGAFLVDIQFNKDPDPIMGQKPDIDVVQATMVNEQAVQRELDKLKAAEDKKRAKERERLKKLEREAEAAKKKRIKEQQRLKDLERKRNNEQLKKDRLEKERKAAEKKQKEAQHKRELAEKKRIKAEKAAEQKRIKEAKRKREAEIKRKKAEERQKRAEAKRVKEAERIKAEVKAKRLEEARQRRLNERRERQRQLDEENQRLEGERAKKANKVINRYKGLIQRQVESHWRKPATAKNHMSCDVYVKMMPGGDVLKVEARKCIGDDLFKRSVEDAVRAAAPLPLPSNKSLFTHFREITFKFKPSK